MPQLCYQHHPGLLKSLTYTKQFVIARTHLVITILKLKPNNNLNFRSYKGVCRHYMLLPQNLETLLNLFSLETTFVDMIIRVV